MNSNGRSEVEKFDHKCGNNFTYIHKDNDGYYKFDNGYDIYKFDSTNYFDDYIAKYYEGIGIITLTGNPDIFTPKRIIVIQMEEDEEYDYENEY